MIKFINVWVLYVKDIIQLNPKYIFAYGTFYIAPIFSYQVFITRTYAIELNCFYTTSFSILKNKKQTTNEILLFEEIKKNSTTSNAA
ncbi:hypothetical protein U3516DRAFT_739662 [Neocallimastix sp. 'constans']